MTICAKCGPQPEGYQRQACYWCNGLVIEKPMMAQVPGTYIAKRDIEYGQMVTTDDVFVGINREPVYRLSDITFDDQRLAETIQEAANWYARERANWWKRVFGQHLPVSPNEYELINRVKLPAPPVIRLPLPSLDEEDK